MNNAIFPRPTLAVTAHTPVSMVAIFKKSIKIMSAVVLLSCSMIGYAETIVDIQYIDRAPVIDGKIDQQWQATPWFPMDNLILGALPREKDFSGSFKLRWDEEYLYLMAKIRDDVLADAYPDPKVHYWDDDSLEIFLDPDGSGGDHLYSYNAFAYHLALDGNAVDLGDKPGDILLLNDHVENKWARSPTEPHEIVWEAKIKFYSDDLAQQGEQSRMPLSEDHVFGFMLAYCDADGKGRREHFVGSQAITPINGDKDLGYKTADVFTKMRLVE